MFFRSLLRQFFAASFALITFFAASTTIAQALDVTVTDAKIKAGKLTITGTTTTPNMMVRLDGRAEAKFNTTSNGSNAFSFAIVYFPQTCIVKLQKLTPPSTLGPATNAVVSGCAKSSTTVFFAQVNSDGTLANSSDGVTSSRISTGVYEVDFGQDISTCAYVMTQGEAGVGGAAGGITAATDRSGNAEAVFATMRTDANVLIDRAFQLVVVCQ